MHVASRSNAIVRGARRSAGVVLCCGILLTGTAMAAPAGPLDLLDLHLVAELEQRALLANPREQSFLYADLTDRMTMLASRQIADGEFDKAEATLQRLEAFTARMENNFTQSKNLKKTELLLHSTNRRLTDMARAASVDMKPHVQDALKRLNLAQASLLATMFAK